MASPSEEILARWRSEKNFAERDAILDEMFREGIFPSDDQDQWEAEGGLYPDLEDPLFVPKLLRKREFLESKQDPIEVQMAELKAKGVDKCHSSEEFELTSVQRFVSRFLNPRTPYRSALLYHGVGVGKTCAAVTVAESFLEMFPEKKVFIVAPPNIQEGFKRTIFDMDGLVMGEGDVENRQIGCTGNTYLELTGTVRTKEKEVIGKKIEKLKQERYEFFGYQSFYNYIKGIISSLPKTADPEEAERTKKAVLREKFSNRVLIIDEAHNLRDNPLEAESEGVDDAAAQDKSDSQAGKKLTPYLKEVLDAAEDMTLLLMTATPMYNSYLEIIFLLNLLLKNDKYKPLVPEDIFNMKDETFQEGGEELLGKIAGHYVSFMRGENPLTFPLRLFPKGKKPFQQMNPDKKPATPLDKWPKFDPRHTDEVPNIIDEDTRRACAKLPILQAYFSKETEELYIENSETVVSSEGGLQFTNLDKMVMSGNFIFPGEDVSILERLGDIGFQNTFIKERRGSLVYYKNIDTELGAGWLYNHEDRDVIGLRDTSGKCKLLLERLATCRGVAFVYSRFVMSGALPIALALEANGYTPWNREIGYLAEGNQDPRGRQCALCPRKEKGHGTVAAEAGVREHAFVPARYVILTGNPELSPNNAKSIRATRAESNLHGEDIKVILGSQIAGEGLDFRYIREVFVFDAWYHLNKLEQIVGRGIRNCSHAAFVGEEEEKRNCTISLLCNRFITKPDLESIDLYGYRVALSKAETIGQVSRVLKEYAIDCGLNKDAILMTRLGEVPRIRDSQGDIRENHPLKDADYSPMCDWLENCVYECKVPVGSLNLDIPLEEQDSSTYDEYTVRTKIYEIKKVFEDFILEQEVPFLTFEQIESLPQFSMIPKPLLASVLNDIVEQKDFRLRTKKGTGRIIFKNGFYVFQPDGIQDTSIPIAIRTIAVPTPRDRYDPISAAVGEAGELRAENAEEDSEQLWEECKAWADTIKSGSASSVVPIAVISELEKLRDSASLIDVQKERLEMILYLYESLKEDPTLRAYYASIVLEYLWDEFLTHGTKRNLLMTKWDTEEIRAVASESYWELEGNLYIRLLHPNTNVLEYICVQRGAGGAGAAPCPKAVIEVLKREEVIGGNDPLLLRPLDVRYTGFEYGFLNYNPKKKAIVYKKGKPPAPKGKVARGSECSINSGTGFEIEVLVRLGKVLKGRDGAGNDLGMNPSELGRRKIQNSVRVCTVSDLVLRYMDKLKLDGKRWFYRPVEAYLYKHPLR